MDRKHGVHTHAPLQCASCTAWSLCQCTDSNIVSLTELKPAATVCTALGFTLRYKFHSDTCPPSQSGTQQFPGPKIPLGSASVPLPPPAPATRRPPSCLHGAIFSGRSQRWNQATRGLCRLAPFTQPHAREAPPRLSVARFFLVQSNFPLSGRATCCRAARSLPGSDNSG